jgi:hypothetical protein
VWWRETFNAKGELIETVKNRTWRLRGLEIPDDANPPSFEECAGGAGGIRYRVRSASCHFSVDIFDEDHSLNSRLAWCEENGRKRFLFRKEDLRTKPFRFQDGSSVSLFLWLELEIRVIAPPRERIADEHDRESRLPSAGRYGSKRSHRQATAQQRFAADGGTRDYEPPRLKSDVRQPYRIEAHAKAIEGENYRRVQPPGKGARR